MRVFMLPRWIKCSLARIGAVKLGVAACPFNVCTIHRLQSQATHESGPLEGFGATPGVPYQAMSTRPSSPATAQANTLLCSVPTGDPRSEERRVGKAGDARGGRTAGRKRRERSE